MPIQVQVVIFILTCYGLTGILAFGHILEKIRPRKRFFHCPMCIGFWVGVTIFSIFWINGWEMFPSPWWGVLVYGSLSSGTSYFLHMIVGDDGLTLGGEK